MTLRNNRCLLLALVLLAVSSTSLMAIEKDNRGRWETPTTSGPDKDVPGYLVNLGPTGARAILESKSFIVKYIFKDSPADGQLQLDDVITGVNGKPFIVEHTFGHHLTRMKEFPDVGYEGPLMDFGNAIEESEGKDGKLTLSVTRKDKQIDVIIQLKAIGTFSKTYPFNCKKSALIAEGAMKYISNSDYIYREQCHAKCMSGLVLLAAGELDKAKKLAHSWNTLPGPGVWVWPAGYQCIFLSEYYLITKDESVLDTIQGLATILEGAQVADMNDYKDRTHGNMGNVGHKFRTGGFGHNTNVGGYGTMTITTAVALTAWELAKKCGAKVDQQKVDLGFDYLRKSTTKDGYIGYHTEVGRYSPTARQGLAIILHKLAGDNETNRAYIKQVAGGLSNAKKYLNDAHADNVLAVCWGLLGTNVSGDTKAIRDMMDYNKAWLNMARCYDGSFVALPGRDMYDKGYYMSSRLHLTAAMALVFSIENPKLKIQGK
ncbi:MAG: DUF6288 domain-containing protein [Phycisphaerae bacterium]|nr:DUF6288 domain-containing protein [Phycisphaerae bacterium]